ncbi:hypothetical protein GQ44DRAFT_455389 [Phaeosphaeriaceae sp. PMI808]|nr:hypothetical protein GQ44DRAFT_455389 [Phaeosphaeriaceae sp. PMI808]
MHEWLGTCPICKMTLIFLTIQQALLTTCNAVEFFEGSDVWICISCLKSMMGIGHTSTPSISQAVRLCNCLKTNRHQQQVNPNSRSISLITEPSTPELGPPLPISQHSPGRHHWSIWISLAPTRCNVRFGGQARQGWCGGVRKRGVPYLVFISINMRTACSVVIRFSTFKFSTLPVSITTSRFSTIPI